MTIQADSIIFRDGKIHVNDKELSYPTFVKAVFTWYSFMGKSIENSLTKVKNTVVRLEKEGLDKDPEFNLSVNELLAFAEGINFAYALISEFPKVAESTPTENDTIH